MTLLVRSYIANAQGPSRIRVRRLPSGPLPHDLAEHMARFERRFVRAFGSCAPVYRLHAHDYNRLYRSIGSPVTLIAQSPEGHITGTLSIVLFRLAMPSGRTRRAAFATNLLVLPEARTGQTLARLVGAAFRWTAPRATTMLSVLPDGSPSRPDRFLTRLGLPTMHECGRVRFVSFPAHAVDPACAAEVVPASEAEVRARHRRCNTGRYAMLSGDPSLRAARAPQWITLKDGSASACIEDYEAAKRHVFIDGSGELAMNSLSYLGARDAAAAGRILRAAAAITGAQGVPTLQLTLDADADRDIVAHAGISGHSGFDARVMGFALRGLPPAPWSVNSTEI